MLIKSTISSKLVHNLWCFVLLAAEQDSQSGFEKGWQAEEILGATEIDRQILFLIKW